MITAPTDALLDEAEAIVRAEWIRLQHDMDVRRRQIPAEMPTARLCAKPAVVSVALDQRGARQPGDTGQWPARRRSGRVWPTQRSPPQHDRN
jgi:hypothetical protein